ncbi:hypothetical protein HHK36_010554 [Tetracentron sinense]|uniref:Zinc-ribbon domain-containing protein n=1 Tax=Tetracentron sinense TaxID=13715 RepID=A0A835DJN2_TETSI|nr:hypothetical protein HHK36_010554 [Tetracentron sinense]
MRLILIRLLDLSPNYFILDICRNMTSRPTKVRLVRCPKCRQLLPELPSLPVYKCGGCGIVLRAKICIEGGKNVGSGTPEIGLAKKNEPEHDSGDNKSGSSSQKTILTEEFSSDIKNGKDQNGFGYCDKQQSGSIKFSNGVSSSSELTCHENEESSSEAGGNREVDGNSGSVSNFRSSSLDSQRASRVRSSILAAQRPLDEIISSETGNSSLNEHLQQPQKIVNHDFDHTRSRDAMETTELVDHRVISANLGGGLGDVSRSPMARSAHAYDGSVSSHDDLDDQVPDQHLLLSKRTLLKTQKVAKFVGTRERPIRDNDPVNNRISIDSDVQHQARKFLSVSSNEKHDLAAIESTIWDREESLEPKRHGTQAQKQVNSQYPKVSHPVSNWTRLNRDGFQSREPFYQRGSISGSDHGSPSSLGNEVFLCSTSSNPSEKLEYHEQDRTALLKMVDELRDQLYISYTQRGNVNGRIPNEATQQEKPRPSFYNYEAPEEEILRCCDGNYLPYTPGRYEPRKTRPQQCGYSQMPFSGQATNCGHHVDYSCLQCYHQDWQYPLQFPPLGICCNKGLCMAYSGHTCHNPYSYSPASLQQHINSDCALRARDTQSHEQRRMDNEVNMLHLRERRLPVKRHCRPIAGGAPFVVCYCCRELLQLPADFLLSRKRFLRLRCGGCSEVLKFSFHHRTQIVPSSPNPIAPPPSEVDNSSHATTRKNLASTSHINDFPQGHPVSSSEDYGLPFCKSGSIEWEPAVLTTPYSVLQSNTDETKKPSDSSFELMEERKKKSVLKQAQYKQKNPVEASESARPSSSMAKLEKLSLEAVVPQKTASPLHRLMGYSSPSELINGYGAGTESCSDQEKNLG